MRSPPEVSSYETLIVPLRNAALAVRPSRFVKGDRTMRAWAVGAATLAVVLLLNGIVWTLVVTS